MSELLQGPCGPNGDLSEGQLASMERGIANGYYQPWITSLIREVRRHRDAIVEAGRPAQATRTMTRETEQLLIRAACEAEDALESLRRGHGAAVGGLCYPAMNTVRDAIEALRKEGLLK